MECTNHLDAEVASLALLLSYGREDHSLVDGTISSCLQKSVVDLTSQTFRS